MKATVLLENHAMFCKFHAAEHGYSAWLEDGDIRVLLDTGYSDKFIKNAEEMGIDLREADYVVISHGHYDHAGGLKYLIKYYKDHAMARKPILLMSDPCAFDKKYQFEWQEKLGMDVSLDILKETFDVRFSHEPVWMTDNLVFMGKTEISNDFERSFPQSSQVYRNGAWQQDFVDEDSQIAYKHKNGEEVSVFTTCAHYGICNIMEYAKKLTGAKRVHTYLGGSHLRSDEVPDHQMEKTCEYLSKADIKDFYICHDTDLECTMKMYVAGAPVREAGVGLVVELD